jgi:hypothetical protein
MHGDKLSALGLLALALTAFAQDERAALRADLLAATTKHLDLLLDARGTVLELKGKSTDAMTASAFQIAYELTGNQKYRAAAVQLADRIVAAMRATKFGVLYIKDRETVEGRVIPGGGPPAMGGYTATAADILHREGGRDADLRYIATVLDKFPWNEKGWWSADIDVRSGESKQPISKPSPINKNVAMAAAAARVADHIRKIDPALSARLRRKAETCLYDQIIPAQEADGYFHYGLTGNDPRNKDILNYFMVTMDGLIQVREYTDVHKKAAFAPAFDKAGTFAVRCIASITDPNHGPACADHTTPNTPAHYDLAKDPKKGFRLGLVLVGTGHHRAALNVMKPTLRSFPYGDRGSDGSHAVHPCALMLRLLSRTSR